MAYIQAPKFGYTLPLVHCQKLVALHIPISEEHARVNENPKSEIRNPKGYCRRTGEEHCGENKWMKLWDGCTSYKESKSSVTDESAA